jgi:hypothetical protein
MDHSNLGEMVDNHGNKFNRTRIIHHDGPVAADHDPEDYVKRKEMDKATKSDSSDIGHRAPEKGDHEYTGIKKPSPPWAPSASAVSSSSSNSKPKYDEKNWVELDGKLLKIIHHDGPVYHPDYLKQKEMDKATKSDSVRKPTHIAGVSLSSPPLSSLKFMYDNSPQLSIDRASIEKRVDYIPKESPQLSIDRASIEKRVDYIPKESHDARAGYTSKEAREVLEGLKKLALDHDRSSSSSSYQSMPNDVRNLQEKLYKKQQVIDALKDILGQLLQQESLSMARMDGYLKTKAEEESVRRERIAEAEQIYNERMSKLESTMIEYDIAKRELLEKARDVYSNAHYGDD